MKEILKLAIAQLRAKPFNTSLSIVMFTIGMSIISILMHFENHTQSRMQNDIAGIDLVVGAKGSPLQLVLSSVFHADYPTGNISLQDVDKINQHPLVKQTIPIALGDNYKGYRIVGSNSEYPQLYEAKLSDGQWNSNAMEVTLGAKVAAQTGLKPGDQFTGVHGFMEVGHHHDEDIYTVTGIMEKNHSIIDQLILTKVESVWAVHDNGHEACTHEHHEECDHNQQHESNHEHHEGCSHNHSDEHQHNASSSLENVLAKVDNNEELSAEEMQVFNEHRGHLSEKQLKANEAITSLLVFYKSPMAATTLPRIINQNTVMQAASPAIELNRLLSLVGIGLTTLRLLAWIIIIFSAFNLLIHMLNRLNQELNELALLRALGISRFKSLLLLLSHGLLLVLSGWMLSIVTTRIALLALSHFIEHIDFSIVQPLLKGEYYLLIYAAAIGVLAALIPAIKAYKTNIHFLLNKL
ncbi:ABC transporter permease [Carboxylicivirga sp. A043]|uniref:ABC transporter permease n=1 Tax=Carboxylicivirga litoralis TaxID=2816963 RepID=UPI0021CAFCDB|nr:ABC transporter permease [Carboxylicivirga sp. A043]MCU4154611.1 ABC transporter permease [Carboxylicivirga sp. A043]